MSKNEKMTAVKPFVFRGVMLSVDEELQPDNEGQGRMLERIGLATYKRKSYRNRMFKPPESVVMTTTVGN